MSYVSLLFNAYRSAASVKLSSRLDQLKSFLYIIATKFFYSRLFSVPELQSMGAFFFLYTKM